MSHCVRIERTASRASRVVRGAGANVGVWREKDQAADGSGNQEKTFREN